MSLVPVNFRDPPLGTHYTFYMRKVWNFTVWNYFGISMGGLKVYFQGQFNYLV